MSHFIDNPQIEEILNEELYDLFSLLCFDEDLNERKEKDDNDYVKCCYSETLCDV